MALCSPATEFLECMDDLDRKGEIVIAAAPLYHVYGLMMSCQVLLRLVKTSFSRYIDVERAKTALFTGINLSKRMSVVNNDLLSRNAVYLTQLWNSNRVFKRPDGSEMGALRIRSRLAMSPVLDGVVWWREEYGGFQGVYPPPMNETANASVGTNADALPEPSSSALPTESQDFSQHLPDPFLAEFGWPMDDDIFSSMWTTGPTEPSMGWVSMMDGPPPFT